MGDPNPDRRAGFRASSFKFPGTVCPSQSKTPFKFGSLGGLGSWPPGPDRLGSARHGRIPRGPAAGGAAPQPSSTTGTCLPPPSSQGIIALRGPRRPAWPGPGQTRAGRPVLSPWTEGRLPFRPGRSLALFLRPTLPARRPGRWGHWPPAELVRVRSRWAMPRCAGWPGIQPAWVRALSLGRRPGALPHSLFTSAFCRSAGGRGHCGSHFSPAPSVARPASGGTAAVTFHRAFRRSAGSRGHCGSHFSPAPSVARPGRQQGALRQSLFTRIIFFGVFLGIFQNLCANQYHATLCDAAALQHKDVPMLYDSASSSDKPT